MDQTKRNLFTNRFVFVFAVMVWCLYFLTKHPEIQERVFQEIEEVLGDEDIKLQISSELRSDKPP